MKLHLGKSMPAKCMAGAYELILHSELVKTNEITTDNAKLRVATYSFWQSSSKVDCVTPCNPKALTN